MWQRKITLGIAIVFTSSLFGFVAPTQTKAADNLIANPSVETANGSLPTSWVHNKWGTNSATFTYPTTGAQNGTRSVKVTMASYTSGDAKWYFNPVTVVSNTDYTFTSYYKSTVPTRMVGMSLNSQNVATYFDIGTSLPAAPTNWTAISATVRTPADAQKVTILHIIEQNGWLQTDNASLSTTAVTPPTPPTPPAGNLVLNHSVETLSGTTPANWTHNKWGTSTATFTTPTTGAQDGTRSVKVTMTSHTSGDAKWYFNPVTVLPNTDYTFTEYYKSSVPTQVLAVSFDASNTPTYIDLATSLVSSANTWKSYAATVRTPANAQKLTIYHVIKQNGNLSLDNLGLSAATPPPAADLVPNNSVEIASATDTTLPTSWTKGTWGTNTAAFEYVTGDAHQGTKSVKVTLSDFVSGDAKWMFAPQTLTKNKDYKFSAWYKTNTVPHVVAEYTRADGSQYYFGLPDPQPTGPGWQQYSDVFHMPQDAESVSVFFYISNNGWVQTDDYHITPFQYTPWNRGLVSLVFDDGFENNITTALPTLDQYGFKATQCNATQFIEDQPAQIAIIQQYIADGHEICSHSVSHPALTDISTEELTYELSHSKEYLEALTESAVTSFASPYGGYNAGVNTEIKKFYASHRTTDEGYNSKDNFNPYRLRVQNMQINTTLAEVKGWIDKAEADKTWLILLYHIVDTGSDLGQFDTLKPDFDAQMAYLASTGVHVSRWDHALTEVKAQLQ